MQMAINISKELAVFLFKPKLLVETNQRTKIVK
jgi:hypothetical protein